MPNILDNFNLRSKKFIDSRMSFKTKTEMISYERSALPEGMLSFCEEDNKYYTFNGADWVLFKGESGQASISQEQGNDLEQKGDGLYISKNIEWVVD